MRTATPTIRVVLLGLAIYAVCSAAEAGSHGRRTKREAACCPPCRAVPKSYLLYECYPVTMGGNGKYQPYPGGGFGSYSAANTQGQSDGRPYMICLASGTADCSEIENIPCPSRFPDEEFGPDRYQLFICNLASGKFQHFWTYDDSELAGKVGDKSGRGFIVCSRNHYNDIHNKKGCSAFGCQPSCP
jgi:hypothetical protein